MGCQAFTPPLVGLAKELEGQPFHLVASHNQRGDAKHVRHEIFRNGLEPVTTNVSVTKSAGHPGVRGTGYVPYYLVFDHHGDLVHHHQGGPYHGGDGLAVLDRVRSMLEEVPQVYVGKEPYAEHAELAAEIASGKESRGAIARLQTALDESKDDPELTRLAAFVELMVVRRAAELENRLALDPKRGFTLLDAALSDVRGTAFSAPLEKIARKYEDRNLRKRLERTAEGLASVSKTWSALETVRGNGGEVRNPLDARFRRANERELAKLVGELRSIVEEGQGLPTGRRAQLWLDALGG